MATQNENESFQGFQRLIELEIQMAVVRIESSVTRRFVKGHAVESARTCAAQLSRVLAQAFDGQPDAHPERAADAAFKLVTCIREMRAAVVPL